MNTKDKQRELILRTCRYCAKLIDEMPDFAGRTHDHPLGCVQGILRHEACELLDNVNPEDVLNYKQGE
jgi:hypothetical protein